MQKIIQSTVLITLIISPSWAEDVITNHDANLSNSTVIQNETAPEITPQTLTAIPPVSTPPAQVVLPSLSREDNASLHLNILRDEVDSMTQVGFFGSLFSANEELQHALMQDIELFLTIYSDLPITADVMLLKGEMFAKQNQPEAAAVAWLQTMYEFPKTDAARQAKEKVYDLIKNDWDDAETMMKPIIKNVPSQDVGSRLRILINQLYPIDDQDLVASLTLLQLDFLKRFSTDPHADEVQVLLAHNMGAKSAESGIFGFKKLLALYPNSGYRPEAMLAIADLQRLRLKKYEKAEATYQKLIQEYPEHKLAQHAYKNLALIQAQDLKKYPEAVATNSKIVELYPQQKISLKALQNMAKLQEKKLDEPREAIASLRQLATMFHGYEATDALSAAISIASKRVKDDQLAYEIRQQLLRDYPNSDEAPEALFFMAEYMETQGNPEQATTLYNQLLSEYPDHNLADKVRKQQQSK
ncbi:MAG: tetratricopeptide repeat protein [Ghiorsea sp.]|nr:tetratricopeptide repeat protein [Ghiorsea sp.]